MRKLKEYKKGKVTSGRVPGSGGRDHGRAIVVKLEPHGVWLKPKGRTWGSSGIFVSWDEIWAQGQITSARVMEALKGKEKER